MKWIIQVVTEKREKPFQDSGILRGLIKYISTCCDLLLGDGWTSKCWIYDEACRFVEPVSCQVIS